MFQNAKPIKHACGTEIVHARLIEPFLNLIPKSLEDLLGPTKEVTASMCRSFIVAY